MRAADTSRAATEASSSQSSGVRPSPTRGARLPTSTHHARVASTSVPNPGVRRAVSSAQSMSGRADVAGASAVRDTSASPIGRRGGSTNGARVIVIDVVAVPWTMWWTSCQEATSGLRRQTQP